MNDGLSAADVLALTNRNTSDPALTAALINDRDDGMWSNPFVYLVWMWAFSMFGGGGWGQNHGWGYGCGGNALTQAELQRGFDNQSVMNKLNGLENGLCDGFYAMNSGMLNGFNGIQRDLCSGFNETNQNINQARFESQQCCCDTNRNIDAVRYENAKNTCDIITAIRYDGDQTRALINANTMQSLRDKLADKDRDLQSANFQLSQREQSAYLVNQLRPCPVPAYPSCSPYASYSWSDIYGRSGCGCGC